MSKKINSPEEAAIQTGLNLRFKLAEIVFVETVPTRSLCEEAQGLLGLSENERIKRMKQKSFVCEAKLVYKKGFLAENESVFCDETGLIYYRTSSPWLLHKKYL